MKFSLNTIRTVNKIYGSAGDPAPDGVDALVQKIGTQLGAVEEIVPYGERFNEVVVAKVVSCTPHNDSDHLNVCMVDDGGKVPNVNRDSKGHVQVVCGAPNVREGLTVAWLPPGATVPESLGKEPFVLDVRDIRGVKSNGMLASPRELAVGDNHDGIWELDTDAKPGTPFNEAYSLEGEAVIDIENKMFTHRPDCFGSLGIARELEGIQQRSYKSPAWYTPSPDIPEMEAEELPLTVRNELPELVPRFTAISMSNVTIKPSPVWLQILLAELGMRSINNIVDYTNFFMLETGQPLHAYDYDKVKALSGGQGAEIIVRHPNKVDGKTEELNLLNGKSMQPRDEAIIIATDKQAIGLGGVMGGTDTEVDEHTKNIIIESANFDMYNIRRTSMEHGLFTDAVTRFSKGQSPLQNLAVLAKIVDEIRQHADGKVASKAVDDNHVSAEAQQRGSLYAPITLSADFVNTRLGLELSANEMAQLLQNVEMNVTVESDQLTVTAPFWRTDLELPEDIVEEVGRLYGYQHLPDVLPKRSIKPAAEDKYFKIKAVLRSKLAAAGANEVLTYTFVHEQLLQKVGQSTEQALQLSNALSPELQYYRLSLTPSLLDKVYPNIRSDFVRSDNNEFGLFELNQVHNLKDREEDGLPHETSVLGFVFAADSKTAKANYDGSAFYMAKRYLTLLIEEEKVPVRLVPLEDVEQSDNKLNGWLSAAIVPYQAKRSAIIVDDQGNYRGIIGEFRSSVRQALKLPDFTAGFELDIELFLDNPTANDYIAVPKFPKVQQDICLRVASSVSYDQLFNLVWDTIETKKPEDTFFYIAPIDIFQKEADEAHKQTTFRLWISAYNRTLTTSVISELLDNVAAIAGEKLSAERV